MSDRVVGIRASYEHSPPGPK